MVEKIPFHSQLISHNFTFQISVFGNIPFLHKKTEHHIHEDECGKKINTENNM